MKNIETNTFGVHNRIALNWKIENIFIIENDSSNCNFTTFSTPEIDNYFESLLQKSSLCKHCMDIVNERRLLILGMLS